MVTALDSSKEIQKKSLTYSRPSAGHSTEVDTNVIRKTATHSTLPHIHTKKINPLFTTIKKLYSLLDRLYSLFLWVALFCLLAIVALDDTSINMDIARHPLSFFSMQLHVFKTQMLLT